MFNRACTIKLHQDYVTMATNADQRKWRQNVYVFPWCHVGRKRLLQLARDLLVCVKVPETLVAALHSCYQAAEPDEQARIQELVEIIADVHEPIVTTETTRTQEEQRQHEIKVG